MLEPWCPGGSRSSRYHHQEQRAQHDDRPQIRRLARAVIALREAFHGAARAILDGLDHVGRGDEDPDRGPVDEKRQQSPDPRRIGVLVQHTRWKRGRGRYPDRGRAGTGRAVAGNSRQVVGADSSRASADIRSWTSPGGHRLAISLFTLSRTNREALGNATKESAATPVSERNARLPPVEPTMGQRRDRASGEPAPRVHQEQRPPDGAQPNAAHEHRRHDDDDQQQSAAPGRNSPSSSSKLALIPSIGLRFRSTMATVVKIVTIPTIRPGMTHRKPIAVKMPTITAAMTTLPTLLWLEERADRDRLAVRDVTYASAMIVAKPEKMMPIADGVDVLEETPYDSPTGDASGCRPVPIRRCPDRCR